MNNTDKIQEASLKYSVADKMDISTADKVGVLLDSDKYVEILCFTHFARYMSFSSTGKREKKKCIMNGIEVSVVLHLV